MAKTIWKFPLPVSASFTLTLPNGAVVLNVQMQGSTPCLWALVDPLAAGEERRFQIIGTGHPEHTDGMIYCGTFQAGGFVGHVFEVLPDAP